MKNMKKLIFSAISLATVFFTGCDKFLDTQDLVHKNTASYPQSYNDAQQVVSGIYNDLSIINANPQLSFLFISQTASDDCFGGGGFNDKEMQACDLMMNFGNDMLRQFWIDRYKGVFRTNIAIKTLGNCAGYPSDDQKNQMLGEAYFMRAFFYYELASQWENVPLVISDKGPVDPPQATPDQTWGQIISDLKQAISLMPAKPANTFVEAGHADKWAAEAMMARAFLFYTGFYQKTDVKLPDGTSVTKANVSTWIDDCVANSGYSLVPDFRNLWAYTNKLTKEDYFFTKGKNLKWVEDDNAINPESMFAIKYSKFASWSTTIGYSNGYALFFGMRGQSTYSNSAPFGQGWGAGPVAPNLWKDWVAAEPNDTIRRIGTICRIPDELPTYVKGAGTSKDFVQETDYYGKKWSPIVSKKPDGSYWDTFEEDMYAYPTAGFQLSNIHDLVLIRFADVLLMQSELEQNATGLNLVRKRAGLGAIAYSDAALQNERRWELACEGIRWNDIRRWHIAETALAKQDGQACYFKGAIDQNTTTNNGGGYVARYKATNGGFRKIPESEISLSNGVLKQNAGWGQEAEYSGWK
jgi:hypothetical protein